MLFGCTMHVVTPPLTEVCCKSANQADGEQFVTTTLPAPLMEELLVNNLDMVAVKSVCALMCVSYCAAWCDTN